jgi:hypothetical protein
MGLVETIQILNDGASSLNELAGDLIQFGDCIVSIFFAVAAYTTLALSKIKGCWFDRCWPRAPSLVQRDRP